MNTVYDIDYDRYDREVRVHEFMQELPCPKVKQLEPHVAVDSPLISFYPEGGCSSAYIGNLFLQIPEDEEHDKKEK